MPAFEGPIGGENLPTAVLVGAAGEELKALSDTTRCTVRCAAALWFSPLRAGGAPPSGRSLAHSAPRRVVGVAGPNMGTDAARGTHGPDTLHFLAGLDWGRSRSMSARAGKAKTDEADEDGPDSPTFAFRGDDDSFPKHQGEGEGAVRLCLNKSRFVICIGLTTGSTLPRASGLAIGWRSREETARVPEDSEMKSEPARTYAGGMKG
ncbi:hypothetical protein V8D89_012593 [Ganoderma adspersum]